jgi:hypothetical protein
MSTSDTMFPLPSLQLEYAGWAGVAIVIWLMVAIMVDAISAGLPAVGNELPIVGFVSLSKCNLPRSSFLCHAAPFGANENVHRGVVLAAEDPDPVPRSLVQRQKGQLPETILEWMPRGATSGRL